MFNRANRDHNVRRQRHPEPKKNNKKEPTRSNLRFRYMVLASSGETLCIRNTVLTTNSKKAYILIQWDLARRSSNKYVLYLLPLIHSVPARSMTSVLVVFFWSSYRLVCLASWPLPVWSFRWKGASTYVLYMKAKTIKKKRTRFLWSWASWLQEIGLKEGDNCVCIFLRNGHLEIEYAYTHTGQTT